MFVTVLSNFMVIEDVCVQVRRPDDYDAKKVADLGPGEPSSSLNSLVLSQLKRPPPPPPEPELPPAPAPAPALPSAAPQHLAPAASGEEEDGEVGGTVTVTRVLKLEHMVSVCGHLAGRTCLMMHVASHDCCRVLLVPASCFVQRNSRLQQMTAAGNASK